MHPDIEKFWTHSEFYVDISVEIGGNYEDPFRFHWWLMDGETEKSIIGISDICFRPLNEQIPDCKIYLFDGKEYSEEEMLRVIKLAAFI